ncbi:HPr family phosphocarrier protein [Ahrensia marina]|uniref:HPr family phosphocarrier protein n=1 Tax=Ahrensia marina TaxID=1514904 RepID=UPI0035CF609D
MSETAAAQTATSAGSASPRNVLIRNKRGLHARASAKFVQLAESFDAEITVTKGEQSVGGTSIMGLMMLAAAPGCEITVDATGPQADEALDAVCALVDDGFGEED